MVIQLKAMAVVAFLGIITAVVIPSVGLIFKQLLIDQIVAMAVWYVLVPYWRQDYILCIMNLKAWLLKLLLVTMPRMVEAAKVAISDFHWYLGGNALAISAPERRLVFNLQNARQAVASYRADNERERFVLQALIHAFDAGESMLLT